MSAKGNLTRDDYEVLYNLTVRLVKMHIELQDLEEQYQRLCKSLLDRGFLQLQERKANNEDMDRISIIHPGTDSVH